MKTQPERQAEFKIAEGLVAQGDEHLLTVVLENLLGNAWKFTGKNPHALIEFGTTQYDGRQAFFVKDNGAGFDMAYAGKMFSPFQRLHSLNEFPGTGIGLATVKRIISRHGGSVWIEAEVERTTVYFDILIVQS
jgi:light-regulated signal transduction histidine kinase (bacteriophytochrome)